MTDSLTYSDWTEFKHVFVFEWALFSETLFAITPLLALLPHWTPLPKMSKRTTELWLAPMKEQPQSDE